MKDELYKRSCEIKSLTAEAKDKQEELQTLQELRNEFEVSTLKKIKNSNNVKLKLNEKFTFYIYSLIFNYTDQNFV